MIISVNNYQLPLQFGLRHGNMFEITKHLFLGYLIGISLTIYNQKGYENNNQGRDNRASF
jgi:hypothetical protein